MRNFLILIFGLLTIHVSLAQEDVYPVYKGCETDSEITLESCFNEQLTKDILNKFKTPENVIADGYSGTVNVIFLVNREGNFEVLYVNAAYKELENEARRVFAELPRIQPATYNGRPVEMRFGMPINIPLNPQNIPPVVKKQQIENKIEVVAEEPVPAPPVATPVKPQKDITKTVQQTLFPEDHSALNIPFTHQKYDELGLYYNRDENSHTGFKPYQYDEAQHYVDLDAQKTALLKDKQSWGGKKLWNEHFFKVQHPDYWFTIDPVVDLQLGKDNTDNINYTYNNTRAIQIQGGLGKKFNFSTSFYESQGRFAGYVTDIIRTNNPLGSQGTVPGRGKGKGFKTMGYDYPVAEAYISYSPNEMFNFQFGNGKNFIGDGYRSMMLSDVASPYPYIKISTKFWKIKYTNLWMFLEDVRPEVAENNVSPRKFVAIHHLSWNVSKRLNIGFFEAAITDNENKTGFDINFFNPIIFYRAVEFTRGSEGGNALIGLNTKYKLTDNITAYGQFVLDELTVGRLFDGSGYWANKFGLQLGAKYYNAFKIDNLFLQGEFNMARPYTYSHFNTLLNYGHFNQPLAHLWGANFWEGVAIARYNKDRWFASAKLNFGKKGFDSYGFDYGGDIYLSYDNRVADTGVKMLQGNKTNIFIADLQGGYVINPATNLQLFGGLIFRNFDPMLNTDTVSSNNTTWFTIGLRTSLFNWYFDF
ncbi:MAG: energy transducer TonB [Flavobacteriaceae bacterium]|nr:energy transducer TonB [Flavobacteriaceae bacterium]